MQRSTHWPFWAGWPLEGMGVWRWHCYLEEPCEASLVMQGRGAGTQQAWCPCCKEDDFSHRNLKSEYSCWCLGPFFCAKPSVFFWWFSFFMDKGALWATVHKVKRVRHYWATEHALTLFSYAERLDVEPELRCILNPSQKGTEGWFERERLSYVTEWQITTQNFPFLPEMFVQSCSVPLRLLSLQFSDECHPIFLPSRSKCMSDWASEFGGPKWRKWGFSLLQISVKKMLTIVKRKWIWN